MANPDVPSTSRLPDIDEVYPQSEWLAPDTNNVQLDPLNLTCPHQVIVSILQGHPLWPAFNMTARVPQVYIQQLWGTMTKQGANLSATIDNTRITLTKQRLRDVLSIPNANHYPGSRAFVLFPSEQQLCRDIQSLGYSGAFQKLSDFRRKNLADPWQTLFAIVNRCLSPKHAGSDKGNLYIYRIFHAIAFGLHVDYAECIWEDLMTLMNKRSTKRSATALPYLRFFCIIVQLQMRIKPEIRKRPQAELFTPPKLVLLRKADERLPVQVKLIPEFLLKLANNTDPHLIDYCQSHNIPIPAAPEQQAPAEGSGAHALEEEVVPEAEEEQESGSAAGESSQAYSEPPSTETPLERRRKRRQDPPSLDAGAEIPPPPVHTPAPADDDSDNDDDDAPAPEASVQRFPTPLRSVQISPAGSVQHHQSPRAPSPSNTEFVSRAFLAQALQGIQNHFDSEIASVRSQLLAGFSDMTKLLVSMTNETSTSRTTSSKEDIELVLAALSQLSDRVINIEQSCRSQSETLKRRHDDRDDDHHEGEKRLKMKEVVGAEQIGPSGQSEGEQGTSDRPASTSEPPAKESTDMMFDDYVMETSWTTSEEEAPGTPETEKDKPDESWKAAYELQLAELRKEEKLNAESIAEQDAIKAKLIVELKKQKLGEDYLKRQSFETINKMYYNLQFQVIRRKMEEEEKAEERRHGRAQTEAERQRRKELFQKHRQEQMQNLRPFQQRLQNRAQNYSQNVSYTRKNRVPRATYTGAANRTYSRMNIQSSTGIPGPSFWSHFLSDLAGESSVASAAAGTSSTLPVAESSSQSLPRGGRRVIDWWYDHRQQCCILKRLNGEFLAFEKESGVNYLDEEDIAELVEIPMINEKNHPAGFIMISLVHHRFEQMQRSRGAQQP